MKHKIWQNVHTLTSSYLLKNDYHKTCHLLGELFLITSCKIFHSKFLSYEKVERIEKKNLESFCKVIQLAPIYDVSYHLYV